MSTPNTPIKQDVPAEGGSPASINEPPGSDVMAPLPAETKPGPKVEPKVEPKHDDDDDDDHKHGKHRRK